MLKIKNLSVKAEKKQIINNLSLEIKEGEVHVLLGPNASGKTTLAQTIMGFPNYEVSKGSIFFADKEVTKLSIEARVKLGITLAFQHPPVIKGISLEKLLAKTAKKKVKVTDFFPEEKFLTRDLNAGFSGGERKLAEIMQIMSLNPRLVMFDELDAGLDIKNLAKITEVIKNKLLKNGVSLLLITHQGDVLRFLKPTMAHVMLKGSIICSSADWKKVWQTIKKFDYEKCKDCKFSSIRS